MIALRFIASFIFISLPLTWLWVEWGANSYAQLLKQLGDVLYSLVGLDGLRIAARDRFINLIPFIALVLATPRLAPRRRFLGLFAGIGFLIVSHLVFNAITELSDTPRLMPATLATFSDALPLALWILIARRFVSDITHSISSPRRRTEPRDESRQP